MENVVIAEPSMTGKFDFLKMLRILGNPGIDSDAMMAEINTVIKKYDN